MNNHKSFIPAEQKLPELTFRVFILAIVLCLVLAISNAYLALKIGILTSASIPAAVISMGILRFFKNSNILENNLVQTAASAGEAIAGGIVYTIPALIIIQYWTSFSYWENFSIAITGGILGVMFSIPLRKILMRNKSLRFPEGRAIAEILKISNYKTLGVKDIVYGGIFGAALEFCQNGIKILADSGQVWFRAKNIIFGFGVGFSPAMIGAGYLIGFRLAISIFFGALLSWLVFIPLFSFIYPDFIQSSGAPHDLAQQLWGDKIRYVGIGAMLTAGFITVFGLFKPMISSIKLSFIAIRDYRFIAKVSRTEFDIPSKYVLLITAFFVVVLYFIYRNLFPADLLGVNPSWFHGITLSILFYTVIAGFIFCAIAAYFSGMVGVSASPGSAIVIAGLLFAALLVFMLMKMSGQFLFTPEQVKACQAITIITAAMITGMAAISNDNMQDLKVGYILGSTPWKQQLMLILGVVIASAVITPVMQMLYNVYGIAGVMPHAGMDPSKSLPAPPAAAMATLSAAVFNQQIPWDMLLLGALVIIIVMLVNRFLAKYQMTLAILGVAIGMYLPIGSSTPLFIGGLISWLMHRNKNDSLRDTMLACGLIAGAALLDVALAIPFSLLQSSDALNIAPNFWAPIAVILSVIATIGLYFWFRRNAVA